MAIASNVNTNGFTLNFVGNGSTNLTARVFGSGGVTVSNNNPGGGFTFSGLNTYTGTAVVNASAYFQFSGVTVTSGLGTTILVTNNGTLFNGRSVANAATQLISGTGNYVRLGTGPATLSAANTYTGATILQGGTLTLSNTSTVDLGGANQSRTTLAFTSTANPSTYAVRNGSLTLTVAADFTQVFGTPAGSTNLVDLSGLNSLTYNAPANTFVAGGVASAASNNTLRLATTNTITASNLTIGNGGNDVRPNPVLLLGTTNNIHLAGRF